MYQPPKYKKTAFAEILPIIKANPFATFVIQEPLLATHIPVLVDETSEKLRFFAHIANHNEMLPFLSENQKALLIFKSEDAYVSGSWYQKKGISTWDYAAVHVDVKIKKQTSTELAQSLKNLTNHFEKNQENPVFYESISESEINDNFPHITGFWLEAIDIEAVAKLHQKHSKADQLSVVRALKKQGKSDLAKAIKKENKL
ncbi:FMN-binding negative transcriptional regulator [Mesonia sp. K7]|uniref:FMN-binding negative transcriptional regulator n=1 Tax=Mesonia sp. K7 TaxID=2218606 RepID=UPI000DA8DA4D|nr:FMN-binding negative transcriptional regulator [Mesonia sp. K7]PZD79609.1 FMN-binding negative transcriptional regulator [Mesonia sp. K7]